MPVLLYSFSAGAQAEPPAPDEQQLENSQRAGDETSPDNDSQLQQLLMVQQHPLDINTLTVDELRSLAIPDALQQEAFFGYRELLGPFTSKYELQAIPGWDAALLRRIWPYLSLREGGPERKAWKAALLKGDHFLLIRAGQILERSRGYNTPDSGQSGYYPGNPASLLLRYQYNYKRRLQYGLLAEKDPGEQFFRGRQRSGFDFYSYHFFWRGKGLLQLLALGDFTVNMGQGLVLWQNMARGKSSQVLQVKQEAAVLQPYHSSGEINFQRGLGIGLGRGRWNTVFFCFFS